VADTQGVYLTPPLFREAFVERAPLTMTQPWQRWLDAFWQQHTALWQQGQGGTWQPLDPTVSALAALTGTADTFPYFDGPDHMALTGLTAYSRSLLVQGNAGTWRTTLGLGTMSVQNANAVAITGGSASLTGTLGVTGASTLSGAVGMASGMQVTGDATLFNVLRVDGQSHLRNLVGIGDFAQAGWTLFVQGTSYHAGAARFAGTTQLAVPVGVNVAPQSNISVRVHYQKSGMAAGLWLQPTENDAAGTPAIQFTNVAGAGVGSIVTTASATAYNTSSDARLKSAITTLTGALERVRALRPVSFRWKSTDARAEGFLAHELQQVIPDAVTGTPDAVNADGSIRPQGVDHSKLVVWLVGGVQALLARIEALEAQIPA
jgi:Chaperone of endosialidase